MRYCSWPNLSSWTDDDDPNWTNGLASTKWMYAMCHDEAVVIAADDAVAVVVVVCFLGSFSWMNHCRHCDPWNRRIGLRMWQLQRPPA